MKPSLEGAYGLSTPDDSVALYRDWAETYDQSFSEAYGYALPRKVAEAFLSEAEPEMTPVLDVGAGTGLLAEHLSDRVIDALDISPDMLAISEAKGLYRNHIVGDLTKTLAIPDALYGGVVSSGTFTSGHVGPGCLPELLRIARPGALFAVSINLAVYDQLGFGSAFAALVASGAITPLRFREALIYDRDDHDHGSDRGLIALFHRI